MASCGLVNATVKKVPVTVPRSIMTGPGSYATGLGLGSTTTQEKKRTAQTSS